MADISSLFKTFAPSLSSIKTDLLRANRECSQRKLSHSAKWFVLECILEFICVNTDVDVWSNFLNNVDLSKMIIIMLFFV
jgi:hypothetical protein